MVYILITIGAFFSIITTAILKSVTKESKHKTLKRIFVIIVSLSVYVVCCLLLLDNKELLNR